MFNTGSSSNFQSIQEYGQWAGGLSVRSTRQACFFSSLNPEDASSRQRTIDWTGPDHGPRMEQYKQSNHPDQDCTDCFNLRRAQDANFVLHQSSSGPTTCRQAHWTRWSLFAGEVVFGRKTPTLTEPEATPGDRIDLRVSGQPEEPCLLNEKQPKVFLISRLMKQVLKSPNKSTMINDSDQE